MDEIKGSDNIIKFPSKGQKRLEQIVSEMDLKKFTAAATLASMLFVVPLINGTMNAPSHNSIAPGIANGQNRQLASLGEDFSIYAKTDSINEITTPELIRSLASQSIETLPAVGHLPSDLDNLEYGLLSGKYEIQLNNGKVTSIKSQSKDESSNGLRKVDDFKSFLQSNRSLWPVQFDQIEKENEISVGSKRSEIYSLKSGQNQVAKVTVLSNNEGGMLSITIQPQSTNQ